MIPLSGKLYTQPQTPVEIDWSNPLTRGFLKAFIPSTSKAILKGSAPSYLLKPSVTGIGYSGKRTVAYWEASPTALISGNPTWSIVLSVVSADAGIAGGLGLYCERPNATQIVKIAGSAGGSGFAEFVCRDASGNLAIITSSKVVNDGKPHVLAFTRVASNSHIGYVDGINVGASSTNVNGSFGATDAVIGADKANDSADFNGAIPLVSLWNRALSATEIKSLSDNPWQIFKSQSRRIWVGAAGGTNTAVNPGTGSIAITGYAPSIAQTANQAVAPDVGNIVITGYAPTISQPQAVNPGVGSLTITGYAPTVTQNVDVPVNPGVGTIAITGYAPTVAQTANQSIAPNVGNIVITGYAPSISQPLAVNPAVGSLAITGYAPTVTQNVDFPVNPGVGTIAITGYAPTVSQTANQSILPAVGNVAITGYAPAVSQPIAVNPTVGTLAITGYAPTIAQSVGTSVNPDVGSITITGYSPTVAQSANQEVLPGVGQIAITGYAPTVKISSPLGGGRLKYWNGSAWVN